MSMNYANEFAKAINNKQQVTAISNLCKLIKELTGCHPSIASTKVLVDEIMRNHKMINEVKFIPGNYTYVGYMPGDIMPSVSTHYVSSAQQLNVYDMIQAKQTRTDHIARKHESEAEYTAYIATKDNTVPSKKVSHEDMQAHAEKLSKDACIGDLNTPSLGDILETAIREMQNDKGWSIKECRYGPDTSKAEDKEKSPDLLPPMYMIKGHGPTAIVHKTYAAAYDEMKRLSAKDPGQEFVLFKSIHSLTTTIVKTETSKLYRY